MHRQFAEIFDQLVEGVVCVDANWHFTYLNPSARRLLLVGDEVLGRAIWDVYPEALETVFEEQFRRAVNSGTATDFEAFYPRKLIWIRVNAFPFEHGLAVCFADTTATRNARKKLMELSRRLRERNRVCDQAEAFAQTIAHDLLQPLGAILGFSEALTSSAVDELGPDSAHFLSSIQIAANHLNDVSKAIMVLSGVGSEEMNWAQVNMSTLAYECIEILRAAHPQSKAKCSIAPNMLVWCDPRLLRVALQNLLANAWKFSGNEPQPYIEVGMEIGATSEISHYVRDNGVGFDMFGADQLFQPLQRFHADAFEGYGIGLATVKSVIDRHGGRL